MYAIANGMMCWTIRWPKALIVVTSVNNSGGKRRRVGSTTCTLATMMTALAVVQDGRRIRLGNTLAT